MDRRLRNNSFIFQSTASCDLLSAKHSERDSTEIDVVPIDDAAVLRTSR